MGNSCKSVIPNTLAHRNSKNEKDRQACAWKEVQRARKNEVPTAYHYLIKKTILKKGKVVYGQEPPSGESTTTECGFNYQLLAIITEAAQWGTPSCSQPQPATDNGVRDCRSN